MCYLLSATNTVYPTILTSSECFPTPTMFFIYNYYSIMNLKLYKRILALLDIPVDNT